MSDNATTYTPVVEELTDLIRLEDQNNTGLEARALNGSLLQKSVGTNFNAVKSTHHHTYSTNDHH